MDEEWVSITEAAKRLACERSTLSRYLAQHAEALPLRIDGKSKLVEFGALRQHRSENVRLSAVPREARPQAGAAQVRRFAGTQSDGAARKAQADAELREMDLAERRGELTPTAEVDKAGRDAVALMQSAFERAVESAAASASVKYGTEERIWRIVLKQFVRTGLETFNSEMRQRLDREASLADAGAPDDDESPGLETVGALQ